jgi:hypothetical protein
LEKGGLVSIGPAKILGADATSYQLNQDQLHLGCVIATCELVGVDQFGPWVDERKPMIWASGRHYYELTDQERAFGDFSIGRYGWFLANGKMLPEPIPAKGALGLWDWND